MLCSAVYDDTLSRVQLSATAVTGAFINIDRSPDQINWTRVRGGTAVPVASPPPVTGSWFVPVSDYEFLTSTQSQFPSSLVCPPPGNPAGIQNCYRFQSYNPRSMLIVTGSENSYATTPDNAALDIVGDIDLRIGLRMQDWSPGVDKILMAKYHITSNQRSWIFRIRSDGTLQVQWSTDGSFGSISANTINSNAPVNFLNGSHNFVRVTLDVNDGGNNTVKFWTSTVAIDSGWILLGTAQTRAGTTSIFSSTAEVQLAAGNGNGVVLNTSERLVADITQAQIRNGIDGTVVANPDFAAQSPGTTNFNDSAGRAWEVRVNAKIVEDNNSPIAPTIIDTCIICLTPLLDSVWLKSIFQPFLNRKIKVLRDFDQVTRSARGGIFEIIGRSFPVAVTDLRSSKQWSIGVCTETPQQAFELDLMLSSGDPLFVHIPQNSNLPIPTMYVVVGETNMNKRAFSDHRTWQLPITQVAAPGADIVGSTATWQAVLNQFATWQAVLNAHTTWISLMQIIGSPTDVIVP